MENRRSILKNLYHPKINTGIAHREPGIGMVGAGILQAPVKCFDDAFFGFYKKFCEKEK